MMSDGAATLPLSGIRAVFFLTFFIRRKQRKPKYVLCVLYKLVFDSVRIRIYQYTCFCQECFEFVLTKKIASKNPGYHY